MAFNRFGEIISEGKDEQNSLIINAKGDIKNVTTGEITSTTQNNNDSIPSQNDIDLKKYNETLYPTEGSIPDRVENNQSTDSFVIATQKDTPILEGQGDERKIKQNYWDNPQKIKENFNSFDEAMKDEDADRYRKFQDTGQNQAEEISITEDSKWASLPKNLINQNDNSSKEKQENQEALDSNTRANEGFKPLTPISQNAKDFFANEDKIADLAKKDAAHQKELDSNSKANEGFKPLTPISQNAKDFFTNEDKIADLAKKDAAHQRELDSNSKANERFNGSFDVKASQSLEDIDLISGDLRGKNFQNSLAELMDEETAKRYLEFLKRDQEKPLVITPEQTEIDKKLNEIEIKLGEIDSKLGTMDTRLNEINTNIQTLLQGQEAGQLTQEQLLEYIKLLQEQGQIQIEMSQSNAEKYRISMENALNLILLKLEEDKQPVPPVVPPVVPPTVPPVVPPTVPPVVPPVVPPTVPPVVPPTVPPVVPLPSPVTIESARIQALEDQLRELRGENTPEQKSAALGRELAVLEAKLITPGGLTDAEKIRYFDILKQKEAIDKPLEIATQESEKKRKNKEKWIKIVAGVAGAGVALATPAVGLAAVIGITLGGRIIGKSLLSQGEKLRSKSNSIKYEARTGKTISELIEMDKKQKRNQWWANRLGEAGSVLVGGATGYAIGTLFEGLVGKDFYIGMNNQITPEVPVVSDGQTQTVTETPQPEVSEVSTQQASATSQPEVSSNITEPIIENWASGDTFNVSDLGWDYKDLGYIGPRVHLTNLGGAEGELQGEFFRALSNLVPKEQLMGQANGNVVNQFLRAAYNGMNPTEAATKAAEALIR